MSHRDSTDHEPLTERDLAVATLVGRYIERRESGRAPCVRDLFAAAEEFGDVAVDALRTLVACYEAMRASDDGARRRAEPPPEDGTPWRVCGWRAIGPPARRSPTQGRA